MYNNRFEKGSTLNLFGYEQNEYPGDNVKYKEENRKKWEVYYSCLEAQTKILGTKLTITPEAILGFETSFVTMDCKICLNPLEFKDKDAIVWEYASPTDDSLAPLEYDEHILMSPQDRSLQIFNLHLEHTGQYVCKLGQSATAPYFLTVVNISESEMNLVHSPAYSEVLDTEWGEWSSCSTCNAVGKRHKLGYCNVYSKKSRSKRMAESQNEDLFDIFIYGIPCHSYILPEKIKQVARIRKNEMMTGFCNTKCPEKKVFEVRDRNGRVLEQADNSKGIYSLRQQLPPIEPTVERRLQYERKGSDIVLECPGNINSDVPIHWQIGDKNVIPEKIVHDSKGRIYISITDRIHINKAKLLDSNIYSCWQLNELAGTIRLVVEKKIKLNFNHTIMLVGVVLILGTFLYIFVKVIANRDAMKNRHLVMS
ncbi:hypothetical protein ABEB36_007161 [Hypothenemus hampei]|uniref:Ig-like domain-containing protein n=1 Tax=Hypothenemus hampei TaxID=57062 RepID=A0ABD1ET02_HYPHA